MKLVAVDMDGTFLGPTGDYDRPRFERLYDRLQARGIAFVVASGNQHAQLQSKFEPLSGVRYIAENGGVIAEGEQIIRVCPIQSAAASATLALVEEWPEVLALASCPVAAYVRPAADPRLLAEVRPYVTELRWIDEWADVPEPVVKVALVCAPDNTAELLERLHRSLPDGVVATSSGHGSIDLIPQGVNKGTALQWLADRLGLDVADAVAFGDGGNDAELLTVAGLGVAMANAPAWLRAKADDVAPSNAEAGVQQYLERLFDEPGPGWLPANRAVDSGGAQ